MYNDFVLVGPKSDPAIVQQENSILKSLKLIKKRKTLLYREVTTVRLLELSEKKEHSLWKMIGQVPKEKDSKWFSPLVRAFRTYLNVAVNKDAYILSS